jgi:leucyl-tRNA synthetase
VNGKLRDKVTVPTDADQATIEAAALASPRVTEITATGTIAKIFVVPKKLVNVVVK